MSRPKKGAGRKIAIYVPSEDVATIESVEKMVDARRDSGFRSSLSFELVRMVKLGLDTVKRAKGR